MTSIGEAKQGGLALAKFMEENDKLVWFVIHKHKVRKAHQDDAAQAGRIGMMRAIEKYVPEKGAFTTYAYYWIRRYVINTISANRRFSALISDEEIPERGTSTPKRQQLSLPPIKLSRREAIAIKLRYQDDLTFREIAERFGISVAGAEKIVYGVHDRVREKLQHQLLLEASK